MHNPDFEAAIRANPELAALLRLLRSGGWSGGLVTTRSGSDLLVAVRLWPGGFIDVLMIHDALNAHGERQTPLGEVVFTWEGTLDETADRLRELPAPGEPGAPTRVIERARSLRDL